MRQLKYVWNIISLKSNHRAYCTVYIISRIYYSPNIGDLHLNFLTLTTTQVKAENNSGLELTHVLAELFSVTLK